MMAGYTLGTIVGSLASGPIGASFGTEALLPVGTVAFALSGLLMHQFYYLYSSAAFVWAFIKVRLFSGN